jgi:hypothetical protein
LLKDYRSRAPISVIIIGENVWGVAISKENILRRVVFEEYKECINGLHYWLMQLHIEDAIPISITITSSMRYCIALPKLMPTGLPPIQDDPIYCLIGSEWLDIVPNINNEPCFETPTF